MKKITTLLVLFISALAYGQANQVQNASNYLRNKEFDKAKASADAASVHESSLNNPKLWMYRGKIYQEIYFSKDAAIKNLDLDALTKNFKELLVKTFTADELKIFADFYSLPEARTAIKKMGKYMEERRIPFDIAIRNAMRKTAEENRAVQPPPTPDKK